MQAHGGEDVALEELQQRRVTARVQRLRTIIKSLSATTTPKVLLDSFQVSSLLSQFDQIILDKPLSVEDQAWATYEEEIQWQLVGKAAAQTYGVMLKTLLEETIPLSEDVWYWNEVLGSYRYTALYSIQTSPWRLWHWCEIIYADSRQRFAAVRHERPELSIAGAVESSRDGVSAILQSWRQFYGLVKTSIRARSISMLPSRVPSPFAQSRADVKAKQNRLRRLREMSAAGLGVLMSECLRFELDEDGNIVTKEGKGDSPVNGGREEWKSIVEKSVALMETLTRSVTLLDLGVSEFEDTVFASVDDETAIVEQSVTSEERQASRQAMLSTRLQLILGVHLREHLSASSQLVKQYGRPSLLVRYWLPATVALAFSGTILRFVSHRKAAIITWIRDAGETIVDFWVNWVVEPVKRVIGTIRHDEESEVALMSKKSLEGDRASLSTLR